MNKIEMLNSIIKSSEYIVFFGGAGVSTESGIPDFRSKDGIYHIQSKIPPEEILSHHFFVHCPEEFYTFYFQNLVNLNVLPNVCHQKLALLEKQKKLKAVITQNIDSLHEMAGSVNVLHLHGKMEDNYCIKCNKYYPLKEIMRYTLPKCSCGGIIKPDVVLYEEPLCTEILDEAVMHIEKADTFIVAGTSLTVQPASSLVQYFKGKNLIIINYENLNNLPATLVIQDSVCHVFSSIDLEEE